MVMPSRRSLAIVAFAALLAAAALFRLPARPAPADSPDWPVALDVSSAGDSFLAMRADVADQGGVARLGEDCVEVTRWRSSVVEDVAIGFRSSNAEVWTLGEGQVEHRSATGELLGRWSALVPTARRIAAISGSGAPLVYLLHEDGDDGGGRLTRHIEDGAEQASWPLLGEPRDLTVEGSSPRVTVYVVTARQSGGGGWLMRFGPNGVKNLEIPLALRPRAVAQASGDVMVYAQPDGPPGAEGQVLVFKEDGTPRGAWPTTGLVPLDMAARSSSDIHVLGHATGDPNAFSLRSYNLAGELQSTCDRFPQPSVPTPEAAAACPHPTPGAPLWRAEGSGPIVGTPAVAPDGTMYFGTLKGLFYAVDCAGARRWLFDYRELVTGFGPQAFHGSAAVGDDGTIYIGDDILVPNFFFALRPDGSVRWVERFEDSYSQIDTSPALARDGRIFAGAHGWGGGVDRGAILVFHQDGRRAQAHRGVGPITDSPAVLADGSAVFAAPGYQEWVLPTGTPPTATATPSTPTATPAGPRHRVYLPRAEGVHEPSNATPRARIDQPLPPPWETVPVPARLHQVHAAGTPDTIVDLPGLADPSSVAARGQMAWFTASAAGGARLLAYDFTAAPRLVMSLNIPAPAAASPVLGRTDPVKQELEVAVLGTDGRLVMLDVPLLGLSLGGLPRERWSRAIGTPALGAPALGDDGRIYVAAGKVVMALERATGTVAWTVDLEANAGGSVTLAPGGVLYVPTEAGAVHAIGTSAGGPDPLAAWPGFRHDARNTGSAETR